MIGDAQLGEKGHYYHIKESPLTSLSLDELVGSGRGVKGRKRVLFGRALGEEFSRALGGRVQFAGISFALERGLGLRMEERKCRPRGRIHDGKKVGGGEV